MPQVLLSLGGNIGPVAETFTRALESLAKVPEVSVTALSSLHSTTAVVVAGKQTGQYINAAAELSTSLIPLDLLQILQTIEHELDRRRDERWDSRPLDLDLLFYADLVLETPQLTIPHRSAWYRRFVLDPLVEIAPAFVHPIKQCSIRQLRERLLVPELTISLAGPDAVRTLDDWNIQNVWATQQSTSNRFTTAVLHGISNQKISELHLSVGQPPVVRQGGHMIRLDSRSMEPDDTVALMKSIAPERNQQELQVKGRTDFDFAFGPTARFRVAISKQGEFVGMVLRRIPNLSLWVQSDPEPTFIVWCGLVDDPAFEQLPLLPRILPHEPATSPSQFLKILVASVMG